jgi:hypothetical protein
VKLEINPGQSDPVFVVGMNGSGTSMLTESLGRHPDLYAFPGETRMIPHYIDRAPRYGNLENDDNFQRLWKYVISSAPDLEVFNDHKPLPMPDNWREFPRDLASILDAVFRQFAGRHGKKRWCEKSPNNSEHILRIAELFPDSKFVHIIRDGRDCAASTLRRQFRNPELSINRWRKVVADARAQGRTLEDRYLEVKYEELTNDPEYWMKQICAFLDLVFDPNVLQSAMPQSGQQESRPDGYVGRIEPNSQRFKKQFDAATIEQLELIAGDMLNELGYPTLYASGSRDVTWLRARVIRFVDFLKANHRLRGKLTGKRKVTWRKVYRGTLASIREFSSKKY